MLEVRTSRLVFVDQLPEDIRINTYQFPDYDSGKGIKKSGHRPFLRQLVQQDLPDEACYSRSYCGDEILQVSSLRYYVGCDLEQSDRFRNAVPFFTTEKETDYVQQQFPHLQEHELLCIIWGLKECLAKLFKLPLHLLLSSGWLGLDGHGITISNTAVQQHTPIQVYSQRSGTAFITITFL